MEEDFHSRMSAQVAGQKGGRARLLVAAMLAAFLLGGAVVALVAWGNLLPGSKSSTAEQSSASPEAALPAPAIPAKPSPSPSASEAAAAKNAQKAVEKVAQQQGGLEARVVAMEQRLTQLDLQAQAASGNAARAEGLLIAFAARRAIERGAPLGYLGDQLKVRFGDANPNAVKAILDEAANPVTVDQLKATLDGLAPKLVDETEQGISWAWFKREVSELFIIRSDETPSPAPENRLGRARQKLDAGQVETAVAEVRKLPGAPLAKQWIAAAERYAAAERALDLLETAAVVDTHELRDASGKKVQQLGPAGAGKN
jgi:hypothetical protein